MAGCGLLSGDGILSPYIFRAGTRVMESFTTFWLALIVLLAPLVAAALAAASGSLHRRVAPVCVQCGAVISLCGAVVALWQSLAQGQPSQPVSLGTWIAADPVSVLAIPLALKLDLVAAGFIALVSLSTFCGVAWMRRAMQKDGPGPLFYGAASLLLFSAIGVAASTNLGELFVFWQIAGLTSYVLWAAQPSAGGRAIKKLVLIQRVGDFVLLPALLVLAAGLGTLEFDDLFGFGGRWNGFAARNEALVELIGLCLFAACVARCGLFPLFGWIDDLGDAHPTVQVMLEGSCLAPCGAVLLARCLPVLSDAMATARLAGFVCGASVFVMVACASATRDAGRIAAFACASVLALVLLGLATGSRLSAAAGLVLLAVFIPGSAAVMLATGRAAGSDDSAPTLPRWPVLVLSCSAVAAGLVGTIAFLRDGHHLFLLSGRLAMNTGGLAFGSLAALLGLALAASRIWGRSMNSVAGPHDGTFLRLGRNRFYCDSFLFLTVALPVRAAAQLARFLDWFLIDHLVSAIPAQVAEWAGQSFEPIQRKSVSFYVVSTLIGTAMLALVILSLRGSW
jgi:NADH:ubiquinone oxidoreductase subunit 5 (subunit L)/multisubunit Na+/H+ antiporter MnhA subunit